MCLKIDNHSRAGFVETGWVNGGGTLHSNLSAGPRQPISLPTSIRAKTCIKIKCSIVYVPSRLYWHVLGGLLLETLLVPIWAYRERHRVINTMERITDQAIINVMEVTTSQGVIIMYGGDI